MAAIFLALLITGLSIFAFTVVKQVWDTMHSITETPNQEGPTRQVFVLTDDPAKTLQDARDYTFGIVENYDGTDIVLCAEEGIILSPSQFPELLDHKGEDLIVTDGKTLLGADDKAGIAEIVAAIAWLKEHPEVKHGRIRIGFNPDEEIGMGAHKFDVEKFGCEFAYTMDGSEVGELEFENFNAAGAKVKVQGRSVHPGDAKNKMKNA